MYEAYYDYSHTGDGATEVVSLAALVAPASVWARFSIAWTAAMARGGAEGKVLHMRDVVHGRRAFEGWDVERQTHLFKRLVPICGRYIAHGFILSYPLAYFDGVTVINQRANRAHVSVLGLLQAALEGINERVPATAADPVISFMECDPAIEADLTRHFYSLTGLRGWQEVFPQLRWLSKGPAPLQAADLCVYEHSRYVSEQVLGNSRRRSRALYTQLRYLRQLEFKHLTREHFVRHCIRSKAAGDYAREHPELHAWMEQQFAAGAEHAQRERTALGLAKKPAAGAGAHTSEAGRPTPPGSCRRD